MNFTTKASSIRKTVFRLAGLQKCCTFAFPERIFIQKGLGEMAEWSIAAVLKTVEVRASGGSNPSLSASKADNQSITKRAPNFTPKDVRSGVFYLDIAKNLREQFYFPDLEFQFLCD